MSSLRQPRSLQPQQMGRLTVTTPNLPQRVNAWIVWEDGVEELLLAPGDAVVQVGYAAATILAVYRVGLPGRRPPLPVVKCCP